MTTDLQALIQHLRGGDWNLRAPQEMADMIADKLEAALAAAPSTSPAAAALAAAVDDSLGLVTLPPIRVDRATHASLMEAAKSRGVILQALVRERLAPYATPPAAAAVAGELAEKDAKVLSFIGAIGNGMSLSVSDRNAAKQCAEYLHARLAAPRPSASEQAGRAALAETILTYLWRTGFFSGHPEGRLPLEMRDRVAAIACAHDGIEQGASSAPSASPAEAPADDEYETRADGERVRKDRWEWGIRRIVALLWGNRHAFEVDDVVEGVRRLVPQPFNEGDDEGLCRAVLAAHTQPVAPAGQAAAGVQGEQATGEREAFESWAHASGFNIHRDESDKYKDYHRATTRFARDGWLSALAWYTRSAHPVASPAPAVERGLSDPDRQLIEGVLRGAVGSYAMIGTPALSKQAQEALDAFRAAIAASAPTAGKEQA